MNLPWAGSSLKVARGEINARRERNAALPDTFWDIFFEVYFAPLVWYTKRKR